MKRGLHWVFTLRLRDSRYSPRHSQAPNQQPLSGETLWLTSIQTRQFKTFSPFFFFLFLF